MSKNNRCGVVDLRRRPFFSGPLEMITRDGRRLGPAGIAVYCALDACQAQREAVVKQEEVALLLGITVEDVEEALVRLAEAGWLEVEVKGEWDEEATILALVSP